MVVTLVITMTNNNEQRTTNYSKQTQSNPTCSELACTELVEVSNLFQKPHLLSPMDSQRRTYRRAFGLMIYNRSPLKILEKLSGLRKALRPVGLYLVSILRQAANFLSSLAIKYSGQFEDGVSS